MRSSFGRAYDTPVRAVVLDASGRPALADVPEPEGRRRGARSGPAGSAARTSRSCGRSIAGAVLGHEVVALSRDGRRVALVHHLPLRRVRALPAPGTSRPARRSRAATIRPGRVRRAGAGGRLGRRCPTRSTDALATLVEPLACVLRGAERVPRGRVLSSGSGFIGRLFAAVLDMRGDEVFAGRRRPAPRRAASPTGPVDAAVLCAPGGADGRSRRSSRADGCSCSPTRARCRRAGLPQAS